jgi:hypothetical protein
VFHSAKQRIARINKGDSLGLLMSKPKIIAIEPRVSATDRLWSLNKSDRFDKSQGVPQNQKNNPIAIQI